MAVFTLFVVLRCEEVCSLRNLPSGVTVRDIRCRLEMAAGLPAQIYKLKGSQGQVLHEENVLELGKNVWDGCLMRVHLLDCWQPLYDAVVRGDVGWLLRSGNIHFKQGGTQEEDEHSDALASETIEERGCVALYLACWFDAIKTCQGLLSVGVNPNDTTPFHRTPMFPAVIRNHDRVLELLLAHGATPSVKDCSGDTPMIIARRSFSRQCINRIRTFQLVMRGHVPPTSRSKSPRSDISIGSLPCSASNERLSVNSSIITTPRNKSRPPTAKDRQQTVKERPKTAVVYKTKSNFDIHLHPRSISRESGRALDRHQLHNTNSIIRPTHTDLHQPSFQGWGPSSVTSSPRGSSVNLEPGGHTPQISSGVTLRVAIAKKHESANKKSHNVVTWNDPLTDSELFHVKSPSREGKLRTHSSTSSRYPNTVKAAGVSWYLDKPTKSMVDAISQDPNPELFVSNVGSIGQGTTVQAYTNIPTGSVTDDGTVQNVDETDAHSSNNEILNHGSESSKGDKDSRIRFTQSSIGFRNRSLSRYKQKELLNTAKRRIQLAEQQKRAHTAELKRKETFEQWLEKKRRQKRQSSSDEDTEGSSSDDEQNSQAFQDWLKELRERPKHQPNPNSAKSLHQRKTRAIQGLIGIDNPHANQPMAVADSSTYMHAFDEWKEQRRKARVILHSAPTDAKEAKKRLEEKRQELLAMAITFNEWMEHTEERKQLTKVILQGDSKKLKHSERNKSNKGLSKEISFEQWRQKLNERETHEKEQKSGTRKENEVEILTKTRPKKRNVSFEP